MKKVAVIIVVLLMFGCVTTDPLPTVDDLSPSELADLYTFESDPFIGVERYLSGWTLAHRLPGGGFYRYRFNVSRIDGKELYFLDFESERSSRYSWAFWDQVRDLEISDLNTNSLRRDVMYGGRTREIIRADLPLEFIRERAHRAQPTSLRIYGRNDRFDVDIISTEFLAFLKVIEEWGRKSPFRREAQ